MKLSTLLILATVFLGARAEANSVYNRYENTTETGHSTLKVDSTRTEAGSFSRRDVGIKLEADLGDVNITNISFDGYNFTGDAHSSNNRPVDPVSIGTYTEDIETGTYTDVTVTDFDEVRYFDSEIYTHEIGNN